MKLTDLDPYDGFPAPLKHIYLEFVGANDNNVSGKSNKFWEGAVFKLAPKRFVFVRRWGKYGSKGQIKEQMCYSEWRAEDALNDVARKKRDKGYTREVDIITRLSTLVDDA
jgi:predicted DNA-binding WGR domain protein